MSSTLETLQKQISGGEDLASIVKTMKALAATSVRQYEKAAESLDEYYHTVELGLSVVLSAHSETPSGKGRRQDRPRALLIFGSDHGLAGRFNEQIVSFAFEDYWSRQEDRKTMPENPVIAAIGEQVITRAGAAGNKIEAGLHMPSSISAIASFIQQLLEMIESWRSEFKIEEVILFYNRPVIGGFNPAAETMLPVDLSALQKTRLQWQSRSLPTFTMPSNRLLSALLRQYFFVSLYRACALSLAAENVSRLAAMQAAEKNIDERLGQLKTAFQQERQAAITEELLDIISGFRAVRKKSS